MTNVLIMPEFEGGWSQRVFSIKISLGGVVGSIGAVAQTQQSDRTLLCELNIPLTRIRRQSEEKGPN